MPLRRALRILADWTLPTTVARSTAAIRQAHMQHGLLAALSARSAEWALTTLIIVLAYAHALQMEHVALALLAQLAAGLLGRFLATRRGPPHVPLRLLSTLWLLPAAGLVAAAVADAALGWLVLLAALTTLLGSAVGERQVLALARRTPRHLVGVLNATLGRLEAVATIIGASVAGGLLLLNTTWPAALFIAVAILTNVLASATDPARTGSRTAGLPARTPPSRYRQPLRRLLALPQVRVLTLVLLLSAMVSVLLRTALVVTLTDTHDARIGLYGLLIALVGVGAAVGPVPIFRLLGHLRPALLLALLLAAGACMASASMVLPLLGLAALPLLVVGLLSVTGDRVAATVLRRSLRTDDARHALQVVAGSVLVGQVLALVAVAMLTRWVSPAALVLSVSVLAVGVAAALTQVHIDDPLHAAPARVRPPRHATTPRTAASGASGGSGRERA